VADTSFKNFGFAANGAPRARTMPDRLNDIINVKDWGAKGDGVTDDSAAIQAAIDYAFNCRDFAKDIYASGRMVYLPPGTYWVGNTTIRLTGSSSGVPRYQPGGVTVHFVGAGRDATVIKGNNPWFIVCIISRGGDTLENLLDMTIWNENTTIPSLGNQEGSGALYVVGWGNQGQMRHLRLKGVAGYASMHDIYNMTISDCIAECIIPRARADAITVADHPYKSFASRNGLALWPGTIGFGYLQGEVINCRAIGFDIGFCSSCVGTNWSACVAERCTIGFGIGCLPSGSRMDLPLLQAGSIFGCVADRCRWGFFASNIGGSCFAGNVVSGATGPLEPAPISNVTWDSATRLVTVTTAGPHNLTRGTQKLDLISIDSPAFTPDGTGTQMVDVTYSDATHFSYPGPTSSPGQFHSGSWNYPIERGIVVQSSATTTFAANVFLAKMSEENVDLYNGGYDNNSFGTTHLLAMSGTFRMPPGDRQWGGGGSMVGGLATEMCPVPPWLKFAGLWSGPGWDRDIIDAQSQPTFGGVVSGGGSNHYRVRHDGTNFVRIG
jgi:hypothetical protein